MQKSEKPSWRDVKQHLTTFDRAGLLSLVQDLYQANKDNQIFLHTRLQLAGDNLQPYKKTIERFLCPDLARNQPLSVAKAKKAISDYKKAVGSPEGMAELSIFYCESCIAFLGYCGVEDDGYFEAFVRMVERSIKAIQQLESAQQAPFIERLHPLRHNSRQYGYWVEDDIEALMAEYGLLD